MHLKGNLAFTRGVSRQWESQFALTGAKIGAPLQIRKTPKYAVQSWRPLHGAELHRRVRHAHRQSAKACGRGVHQRRDDPESSMIGPGVSADLPPHASPPRSTRTACVLRPGGQLASCPPPPPPRSFTGTTWRTPSSCRKVARRTATTACASSRWKQAAVVNANRGLFQSSTQIKEQYEEGKMGRMAGADWYMDQNVASHTTGARGGAAIVTTAGQTGSAILTATWTASGLRLKARRRDPVYRRLRGQSADAPEYRALAGLYRDGQRHGGCRRAGDGQHFARRLSWRQTRAPR